MEMREINLPTELWVGKELQRTVHSTNFSSVQVDVVRVRLGNILDQIKRDV